MDKFNCESTLYKDFFKDNNDLLEEYYSILSDRREKLNTLGISIYPCNSLIFESLNYLKLEDIKLVLILPHAYSFNSNSGIPCYIRNIDKKPPIQFIHLQKVFKISSENFNDIYKRGVLLYNIALTEEENSPVKISHEIFWSRLFERFIEYICSNRRGLTFCLSGAVVSKYRNLIDTSRDHIVKEIPSLVKPESVTLLEGILDEL